MTYAIAAVLASSSFYMATPTVRPGVWVVVLIANGRLFSPVGTSYEKRPTPEPALLRDDGPRLIEVRWSRPLTLKPMGLYPVFYLCGGAIGLSLLYLFGVLWVVVPLRSWRRQVMPLVPTLEESSADDLTPEVKHRLGELLSQFAAEGFEVVANLQVRDGLKGVRSGVLVLVDRPRGDVAQIITARSNTITRNLVYVIKTHWPDGRSIVTGVNSGPTTGFKDPSIDGVGLSIDPGVAAVCEFHRRRVAAGRRGPPIVPEPGGEIRYIRDEWRRTMESSAERGFRRIDRTTGTVRPTLVGAFATTWQLLRPIKGLRGWGRRRKAMKAWNEAGMGPWPPPPRPAQSPWQTVPSPPESTIETTQSEPVLTYEVPDRPGGVFWRWAGPVLTVTCPNRSFGDVLLSKTIDVVLVCVFLPFTLFYGYVMLRYRHSFGLAPGRGLTPLLFATVFSIATVYGLFNALRRAGRVATVEARLGEIRFTNAPELPRCGIIRTEELKGLTTARLKYFGSNQYTLLAKRLRGGSIRLMTSSDRPGLDAARIELAIAIGIEVRTQSAASGR